MSLERFEVDWSFIAYGGVPHEHAFRYLGLLDPAMRLTALDVGANSGISALSIHMVRPGTRIVSYEANPTLEPLLKRTQSFLAERGTPMEYHLIGLGDVNESDRRFRIPVVDKVYDDVLTMGTFDGASLDAPSTRRYLGEHFTTGGAWSGESQEILLDIRRFDDLEPPDGDQFFVKIDVEGYEPNVLAGMRRFIKNTRPAFLIEIFSPTNFRLITRRLRRYGYRPYNVDVEHGRLLPSTLGDDLRATSLRDRLRRRSGDVSDEMVAEILASERYNVLFVADGSPMLPSGLHD